MTCFDSAWCKLCVVCPTNYGSHKTRKKGGKEERSVKQADNKNTNTQVKRIEEQKKYEQLIQFRTF
jgi:hypothetical protein